MLSTCNRLEVYAEVATFHGGVDDVCEALAAVAGVDVDELTGHLYVHYETAAVAHLFAVACGLESMAVGEQQILGQVRAALRAGQAAGSTGRVLDRPAAAQPARRQARAHRDRAGPGGALPGRGRAGCRCRDRRPARGRPGARRGRRHDERPGGGEPAREGVRRLTLANRTRERALRLAEPAGAHVVAIAELPAALAAADVVVSCTGAVGHVIPASLVRPRQPPARPVPRGPRSTSISPCPATSTPPPPTSRGSRCSIWTSSAASWAGGPGRRSRRGRSPSSRRRAIVAQEVAAYLTARRAETVAPTVVALRARARAVVESELARLEQPGRGLDPVVRAELEQHRPPRRREAPAHAHRAREGAGRRTRRSRVRRRVARAVRSRQHGGRAARLPAGGEVQRERPHRARAADRHEAQPPRPGAGPLGGGPRREGGGRRRPPRAGRTRRAVTDGDTSSAPLASFGGVGVFVTGCAAPCSRARSTWRCTR